VGRYTPRPLSPDIEPWDRQPGEPERHYSYFTHYRDMGRARTLANAAEALTAMGASVSYGHTRNLAARWSWVDRAAAWDREQDRLYAERMVERRRELAEREAGLAWAVVRRAAGRLSRLTDSDVDRVPLLDVIRCADTALRWLHDAYGVGILPAAGGRRTPTTPGTTGAGVPAGAGPDLPDPVALSPEEQVRELREIRDSVTRQLEALGVSE
jgi:hypothetical protein